MEMVWKLLAGIEDGFDNGWLLIRADAGSLLFSLRLLCAFCSVRTSKSLERSLSLLAYLELTLMDQLDEALPDPLKLVWAARGDPSASRRSF